MQEISMFNSLLIVSFVLGGLAHVLGTLIEESTKAGKTVRIQDIFDQKPYRVLLSITLSIAAYIMLHKAGQLNETSAFAASYMGDSIVKKFMARQVDG